MRRRDFIRVMVAGTGVALVPSILNGCDARPLSALDGWRGPDPREHDIRMLVLSYALLAPNPHNKQPWIIDLTGPSRFDLYVDPQRLLPESDPPYRQIHVSQGTFLENLSLAAAHFGYRADIDYFPQGLYGNTVLEKKAVATINLVKNTDLTKAADLVESTTPQSDPLFNAILRRQSNRRPFSDNPLTEEQIAAIRAVIPGDAADYSLTLTTDPAQRKRLSEFATEAMRIEVSDKKRIAESVAMFRFRDEELETHRDGFGAPQMGAAGFKKYLVEHFFISREAFLAEGSSYGEQSIQGVRGQAQSAAAFGWLVTHSNSRLDQVRIGRIYDRLNLTAASLGICIHPMSQILQEYADMSALQQDFKKTLQVADEHTVQMFFRLGIAEPTRHTARRPVKDLIVPNNRF